MKTLFVFGFGYTAAACAKALNPDHWRVFGTSRSAEGAKAIGQSAAHGFVFSEETPRATELIEALGKATHLLVSIPPNEKGDPVLKALPDTLSTVPNLEWIGYLSTIGVYGDHDGDWIDETTPAKPQSDRSKRRLGAETAWQAFAEQQNLSLQIFRLAGIYGPGRSAIERVRSGRARAIIKPGQVFNRTHVTDAAAAIVAGMAGAGRHQIYNLTDDLPAPPQDPLNFAADLIGAPPPPQVAYENAELSQMARSFYSENKRVKNGRMRSDLGVELRFPTFREGLTAIASKS